MRQFSADRRTRPPRKGCYNSRVSSDELRLEPIKLLETAERLERRIGERFGGSGLSRVCRAMVARAAAAAQVSETIRQPDMFMRAVSGTIIFVIVIVALMAAWLALDEAATSSGPGDWRDIPTVGEAVVNEVLLLGGAIWFFASLERKRKRERVINALADLRTLAHLVDIHQLTKNPEAIGGGEHDTASSPTRRLSSFGMGRYLDYCSEMLALIGKVAAVYGEALDDGEAFDAVNDLETLCIGLQRKIWQKIIILESRARARVAVIPGATLLGEEPEEE